GNVVTTTAETYAYPQHTVSHGENIAETSRASALVGESSSYAARNSEYSNAAAFSERQYRHSGAEERERGESVAEFSIGRAKSKDYLSRERDLTEYSSEQDVSQSEEHEVGDVHTRMVTSQKSTSVTKH
ncbi:hypothetical protein GCK32_016896, partial [Trichostrongylus colubriformis]